MKARWYQKEAVKAMIDSTDNTIVVLPTGAGKTKVMCDFVEQYEGKILVLSHVEEILAQNFEALAPFGAGLYSAGLGVKTVQHVTVAGIQSVWRKPELFQDVSVALIDECHMMSNEGMYKTFMDSLDIRYIGLTATPFRLKHGYLHKSGIFDSICYEAPVDKLQEQGYLSPLKLQGAVDEFDVEGLRTTGGDFNMSDASLRFNREAVTENIVKGLLKYKTDYKHWLLFCIDIDHAVQVAACLNKNGINAEAVHSKAPRKGMIQKFKSGEIQAITNVNILTVGFDFPNIDLIVMLRPTKSPVLHVQAIGRGLRVAPGKDHCLIKDFSGNIARLGMIHDLQLDHIGKPKGTGKRVSPFMKTCPDCEALVHPSVKKCECGHVFKFQHNLRPEAHKEHTPPKWYKVDDVNYFVHTKPGKPPMLKVVYICGFRVFTEWVLIEHGGYGGYKAKYWVKNRWRNSDPAPTTAQKAVQEQGRFWNPEQILVDDNDKYPKFLQAK